MNIGIANIDRHEIRKNKHCFDCTCYQPPTSKSEILLNLLSFVVIEDQTYL